LALFDVDGTLFPSSSMEKTFLGYMLRRGAIPATNIFYYFLTACIRSIQTDSAEGFKNNKYYLKYLPARPVQSAARKFVHRFVWPAISATGKERIRFYRQQGYKILIMSGSPDILTNPLADYLQPDITVAAKLEVRQNRFSGQLIGLHPYGQRKTTILRNLAKKYSLEFKQSIVFANHHADFDHMLLFGEAVAVNPTLKLKKMAKKQGWKMESW
jgi:HAD superfamily hydrolase (TIGR01490 family)